MRIAYRSAWILFGLLCAVAAIFYYDPLWVHDELVRYRLWRGGVHSSYIEVNGNRIHYFEAPPRDGLPGTPIVLIHGLGDHAESWAGLMLPLTSAGFHIYAPDLLGYGRSDKPETTYSISLEENTVLSFMHAVHVSRADVDGWSMGGWIAGKLAADHPEAVDRLVLDDAAGLRFQPTFPLDLFTPNDEAGLRRLMGFLTPHPAPMPGFVARAAVRRLQRGSRVVQSSVRSMETAVDALDNDLGQISEPTLIVWGSEDRLLPISIGQQMHAGIRDSVLATITGCGHLAPLECATPVADATIQFLRANPPMPRGEEILPAAPKATPAHVPHTP